MNSNGSNVVRIKPFVTPLREIYYDPAWSPSGERMLVGACAELWERCDAGRLHILDANGTTQQSIGASGLSAQWSPDGDVLAYVSRRCYFGCQPSIRYVLLDGSGRSGLMFANAHSPSWRPN